MKLLQSGVVALLLLAVRVWWCGTLAAQCFVRPTATRGSWRPWPGWQTPTCSLLAVLVAQGAVSAAADYQQQAWAGNETTATPAPRPAAGTANTSKQAAPSSPARKAADDTTGDEQQQEDAAPAQRGAAPPAGAAAAGPNPLALLSAVNDLDLFGGWVQALRLNVTHLRSLPMTVLAPTNKVGLFPPRPWTNSCCWRLDKPVLLPMQLSMWPCCTRARGRGARLR